MSDDIRDIDEAEAAHLLEQQREQEMDQRIGAGGVEPDLDNLDLFDLVGRDDE